MFSEKPAQGEVPVGGVDSGRTRSPMGLEEAVQVFSGVSEAKEMLGSGKPAVTTFIDANGPLLCSAVVEYEEAIVRGEKNVDLQKIIASKSNLLSVAMMSKKISSIVDTLEMAVEGGLITGAMVRRFINEM